MQIFNTIAAITGDPSEDGFVHRFDTIEHEGHWWIVPEWTEEIATKQKAPSLLIRPARGLVRATQTDFSSPFPIPKAVLGGHQVQGWIVVHNAVRTLPPAGSVQ